MHNEMITDFPLLFVYFHVFILVSLVIDE